MIWNRLLSPESNEQLLTVAHTTAVSHLPWIFFLLVWICAPFFFLFSLWEFGWMGRLVFGGLFLSGLFLAWRTWFSWQHTCLIMTDRRVAVVTQRGFFDRTISESSYTDIQDATVRVKGIFSTLFRYGTIRLERKGTTASPLEMRRLRHPARIQALVHEIREDIKSPEYTAHASAQ